MNESERDALQPNPNNARLDALSQAGVGVGKAPLLQRAAGHKGPVYVLTRYGADGKVSEVTEATDTDEGRASLATVMLISLDDARAQAAVEESGRIRRGRLPRELVEAMQKMKRGELTPLEDGQAHDDSALYNDTLLATAFAESDLKEAQELYYSLGGLPSQSMAPRKAPWYWRRAAKMLRDREAVLWDLLGRSKVKLVDMTHYRDAPPHLVIEIAKALESRP